MANDIKSAIMYVYFNDTVFALYFKSFKYVMILWNTFAWA